MLFKYVGNYMSWEFWIPAQQIYKHASMKGGNNDSEFVLRQAQHERNMSLRMNGIKRNLTMIRQMRTFGWERYYLTISTTMRL